MSLDHPNLPQSSHLTCRREGRGVEVADASGARGDLAGDHRALGAQPDVLPLFTAPSVTCTRQLQGARTAPDLVVSSETERDRVRSTEAFPAPPTLPNPRWLPSHPPAKAPQPAPPHSPGAFPARRRSASKSRTHSRHARTTKSGAPRGCSTSICAVRTSPSSGCRKQTPGAQLYRPEGSASLIPLSPPSFAAPFKGGFYRATDQDHIQPQGWG